MVYLVWAIFGGFLLHILLCNYLTVLLKPRHEEPVDFAIDLIKRNITPYSYAGWGFLKLHFNNPATNQFFDPEYQELSQNLVIPKSRSEFDEVVEKVLNFSGSVAWIGNGVTEKWWLKNRKRDSRFKRFYVSEEYIKLGDYPYTIYLSNKKWPLLKVKRLVVKSKSKPLYQQTPKSNQVLKQDKVF